MIKIICALLLLLFISPVHSLANSKPANPKYWERLDYMIRGTVPYKYGKESIEIELTKWKSKVLVSLKGNYTISDSLELDRVIKAFNEVIPQPGVDWASGQNSNLTVHFVKLSEESYVGHLNWYNSYGFTPQTFLNHRFKIKMVDGGGLVINNNLPAKQHQSNIWGSFAWIMLECKGIGLLPGTATVLGGNIRNLTDFDRFFFKTIYADNFTDQYLLFLKSKYGLIDQFRYLTDNNTKSTIILSLQLIFIFLLTYLFYKSLWLKYLEKKTSGKLKRYYTSAMIFFTPQIIVALFFTLPEILKLLHFSSNIGSILIVGLTLFILTLILYFIFTLMAYFIEHILFGRVHDFKQRQIVRIISLSMIMAPILLINLTIKEPKVLIGMNVLVIFLSIVQIMVIRFLYFHDQYQKEIIKNHQQLKIEKLEQLQTRFQLEAIQARTNPHFLYNSLNTIAALAKAEPAKAEDFALKLSKLLRLKLQANQPAELPVEQEMETISLYLEIEKERFSDRMEYSIVVAEELKSQIIPADILIYLVENSIKHGISKQTGKGIVNVEITRLDDQVKMCVADNGPDFPQHPIYGTGLKSILEKLELLYFDNYEFALFNHPNKHVEIKFQRK